MWILYIYIYIWFACKGTIAYLLMLICMLSLLMLLLLLLFLSEPNTLAHSIFLNAPKHRELFF